MTWALDTDSVSFALRGEGKVRERRLRRLVGTFFDTVLVLPFDASAAQRYGLISASLAGRGRPIGIVDTLIAAHALASNAVLVTHNATHFPRVRGLRVEDWY